MVARDRRLRKANESLGGVFEVQAFGLIPGLGSHVSWEERLDGRLAMAICSIQALKGVSIGDGFRDRRRARLAGARRDLLLRRARGYYRETNRAGGLEGGMTNGQPLIVRGAMKPLPTLTKPLRSVDTATHEPAEALRERTDSCTVPAAGVVGEAMVALVLADAYRHKFGGDHIDDVLQAVRAYRRGSGGVRPDRLHGRRQVDASPPSSPRRSASPRSTATRCWRSASGTRSPTSSSCTARRRSERPRRSWCASCSRIPGGRGSDGDRARRRQRPAPSACARRSPGT